MPLHKPKHVFIIGAGFSKDSNYPLVSDMLSVSYINFLTSLFPKNDGWYDSYSREGKEYLLNECLFFQSFNSNIEELFTQFDITNDKQNYYRLIEYMNAILYLAKESHLYNYYKAPGDYLFNFIAYCCTQSLEDISFITFNYDLLIERYLKAVEYLFNKEYLNYKLEPNIDSFYYTTQFSGKADFTRNDIRPPYNGKVPLLKLHGSLNWGLCDSCKSVTIHQKEVLDFKIANDGLKLKCEKCKRKGLSPYILPPSKEKQIKMFKNLWTYAGKIIKQADNVTFIGYSMPEYDEQAYKMIKANCSGSNINPKKIAVLNKFIDEKLKKRYDTLSKSVIYVESGFKDYFEQLVKFASS